MRLDVKCTPNNPTLTADENVTTGVIHDFRNLLAVIETSLRFADACSEQRENLRAYIAAAQDGLERVKTLTSQLLDLAKPQETRMQVRDVNELVINFVRFLRNNVGPGIDIVLELAPDVQKCLLNPIQFDAALLNVVLNARDAMPSGGQIRISTKQCNLKKSSPDFLPAGSYVCLRITDSGHGMAPEVVRKAFEPYFTTKGERGTGLGLPQTRSVIRQMGGDARVISAVGTGTTVKVLLPLVKNEPVCAS